MHSQPLQALLQRVQGGDNDAQAQLFELVYDELRARARGLLGPGSKHTLQATALVNEAWLRLRGSAAADTDDRRVFLAVAARAMRSVLVDHARGKHAEKRGGGRQRVLLDEAVAAYADRVPDVVELSAELEQLAELDAGLAKVVELRFFGGLSIAETAEVLQRGTSSIERDWQAARAFLAARLTSEEERQSDRWKRDDEH